MEQIPFVKKSDVDHQVPLALSLPGLFCTIQGLGKPLLTLLFFKILRQNFVVDILYLFSLHIEFEVKNDVPVIS